MPMPDTFVIPQRLQANSVSFSTGNGEVIRLEDNGDIYIRGKLVENDLDVVKGFRAFLVGCGHASAAWTPQDLGGNSAEVPDAPSRFERLDKDDGVEGR